ncbi:MAG: pyruvate kinase alpha/beta domain-containing protein, partial [Iodobacter sp.]
YISAVPIMAVTQNVSTYRKLALYRHVQPTLMPESVGYERDAQIAHVKMSLVRDKLVSPGDCIAMTWGSQAGLGANTLQIVKIDKK